MIYPIICYASRRVLSSLVCGTSPPLSITHTPSLSRKGKGKEWGKWFTDFLFKSQLSQVLSRSAHPSVLFIRRSQKALPFKRWKIHLQALETVYLKGTFNQNSVCLGFPNEWKVREYRHFFSFLFLADSLYICICWRKK